MKVFERVGKKMPRLAKVWADANYRASALAEWIKANARWALDVVLTGSSPSNAPTGMPSASNRV